VRISCVKSKRKSPAKVKDLYTSTLSQSNLQYAYHLKPDAIYILSAKYGLLGFDQIIAPYEMALNIMTEAEKRAGREWYWMYYRMRGSNDSKEKVTIGETLPQIKMLPNDFP